MGIHSRIFFAATPMKGRLMSVSISPGAIAFTVTPWPASSLASERVSAFTPPLAGERTRERVHAPLGRRIVHLPTPGARDQHGADVDDPSPAAAEHLARGEPRAMVDAVKVRAEHRRPLSVGHLEKQSLPDDPCVVHRSEERRVGKECRSRWSPYH